jgi:hypothetical protein
MSRSDDFNALAAAELRGDLGHGHVYRFAPDAEEPDLLAPAIEVDILGRGELTLAEVDRQLGEGGGFVERTVDDADAGGFRHVGVPLFVVDAKGDLHAATDRRRRPMRPGDRVIELAPP